MFNLSTKESKMKTLYPALIALLLCASIAPVSIAGAPPKIDPNAPPVDYYVEPTAPEQGSKKVKKEQPKKEKKAAEAKQ